MSGISHFRNAHSRPTRASAADPPPPAPAHVTYQNATIDGTCDNGPITGTAPRSYNNAAKHEQAVRHELRRIDNGRTARGDHQSTPTSAILHPLSWGAAHVACFIAVPEFNIRVPRHDRWKLHVATALLCAGSIAVFTGDARAQRAPPAGYRTGILGPKDQRVQIPSDEWPWSAIGRINIVFGPSHRGACTGTVIGPRQVITAAHCLFDTRVNGWGRPESVHFVLGQSGEKFASHSIAESFVTAPQFRFRLEDRPRYDFIAFVMVKHDWAILTLRDALDVKPVPIRAIRNSDLPAAGSGDELALAGYGADHAYVLSVHRGCTAKMDSPDAGTITHMCDSMAGESGGPLLLLHDGGAVLVGVHSADSHRFESQVGYQALAGHGASAAGFEKAATSTP